MLTIRLQRMGKKKVPVYRLIVSEKARDTHDVYLENLGTYNPHLKENQFAPKADRITYWISKGAQTSPTVHNLLVNAKVIAGKKQRSVFVSTARKAKLTEKSAQGGSASGGKTEAATAAATTPAPAPEATPAPEAAPAPEVAPTPAA